MEYSPFNGPPSGPEELQQNLQRLVSGQIFWSLGYEEVSLRLDIELPEVAAGEYTGRNTEFMPTPSKLSKINEAKSGLDLMDENSNVLCQLRSGLFTPGIDASSCLHIDLVKATHQQHTLLARLMKVTRGSPTMVARGLARAKLQHYEKHSDYSVSLIDAEITPAPQGKWFHLPYGSVHREPNRNEVEKPEPRTLSIVELSERAVEPLNFPFHLRTTEAVRAFNRQARSALAA